MCQTELCQVSGVLRWSSASGTTNPGQLLWMRTVLRCVPILKLLLKNLVPLLGHEMVTFSKFSISSVFPRGIYFAQFSFKALGVRIVRFAVPITRESEKMRPKLKTQNALEATISREPRSIRRTGHAHTEKYEVSLLLDQLQFRQIECLRSGIRDEEFLGTRLYL